MAAAVIAQPRRATLTRLAQPQPGPGEVRVALEGCGICGSDVPVWEGRPWFEYPRDAGAPGHEGWGRVDAVGPGVESVSVGDRVAALGLHAYAEYDIAAADGVVRLPASLNGMPFPGEALGCASNVFERAEIASGHTVAVVGAGFLGVVVVALAAAQGAKVIAISRRETARRLAREAGAVHCLAPGPELEREVAQLTGDRMCEVVVEAAGVQATLDLCGPLTRIRGRIVVAGFHQDGLRTVDMQLWNWRGLDVINAHERDPATYVAGMRSAVAAVRDGRIPLQSLITHRVPLERLDEAFGMLVQRPEGFLKAVVQR